MYDFERYQAHDIEREEVGELKRRKIKRIIAVQTYLFSLLIRYLIVNI